MIHPTDLQDLKLQTSRFYAVSTDTAKNLICEIQGFHRILEHLANVLNINKDELYSMSPDQICVLISKKLSRPESKSHDVD
jgi:hypothetical protein